jgi:YidC/Oxa1 family membrane protein insertase
MVAPAVKEIQTTYASNPEVMNQKIAALYQAEKVNPLAGCLPAIVQLPVFIGLYRAILNLSQDNKLNEAFLWLPNLEGPVYGADPTKGSDWILKGWVDGVPPLGWEDTLAFLTLPVLLVVSQYISQALITPKTQDESQQQSNVILQFLPLMIGWFSLNVPAALGIYWVANNIITTAITLQVRGSFAAAAPSSISTAEKASSTAFRPAPVREKPAGFATPSSSSTVSKDEVKPITAAPVVDAEIIEAGSVEEEVEETAGFGGDVTEGKKVRGKKKKGGKK